MPITKTSTTDASPARDRRPDGGIGLLAILPPCCWVNVVLEGIGAMHRHLLETSHQKGGEYLRPSPFPSMVRRSCNLLRFETPDLPEPVSSNQVTLRRPEVTIYRCFLPDLTGFIGFCRAGPGLLRHFSPAVSRNSEPQEGFRSRYSGLRVQGTASSPSSTTAHYSLRYSDNQGGEGGI